MMRSWPRGAPVIGGGLTERVVAVVGDPALLPPTVQGWLARLRLAAVAIPDAEGGPSALLGALLAARPRAVLLDGRAPGAEPGVLAHCRALKAQVFTAGVPVVALVAGGKEVVRALEAGADEALAAGCPDAEGAARLDALLRRSDRDADTHPSSRLAGTRAIAAELERRVAEGEPFAAGYADLDHFKEFNDRYGYHHGDRVIRLLARILQDTVGGYCGPAGFVGHIGGDDFLFVVPRAALELVADTLVEVFDTLIPWQYSEQDRRMGYFFGKDRRGQLHRIPLMTLSIGVVTNQHRRFTRGGEVSDLVTEMKAYAKTLPGSVWAQDRRRERAG